METCDTAETRVLGDTDVKSRLTVNYKAMT